MDVKELEQLVAELRREVERLRQDYSRLQEDFRNHIHTGSDSLQLSPTDFLGFPIVSATPTTTPLNGSFAVLYDGATTYELYVRINNLWKKVALS